MVVRKVAITLPEPLFEMVERARDIEHRTRSEVIQEALRVYLGAPVYVPTDEERAALDAAMDELSGGADRTRSWDAVRTELREP
jgi:metal-responsive CopG/Arc/MetJ family transcriptional regulator